MLRRLKVRKVKFADAVLAHACEEAREGVFLEIFISWLRAPIISLPRQADARCDVLAMMSSVERASLLGRPTRISSNEIRHPE